MGKKIYLLLIMQKVISGLINFALLIFLTSNLSASDYGTYLVYSSIAIAIANLFFQWKANIVQRYYVFNRNLIINYITKSIVKATVVIALLSILLIYGIKFYSPVVGILIFLSAISTGIFLILTQLLNAEQNHLIFIKASILKSLSLIIISFAIWIVYKSIIGLLASIAASGLIGILYILKKYKIKYKKDESNTRYIWNYGKYFLIISLSTAIIDNFDKIIMSNIMGYADTGSYGATQSLIQQLIGAILSIIYMFWSPKIIQESEIENQAKVENLYRKMENFIIITGLLVIAIIGTVLFNIKINETIGKIQNTYTAIFILLSIYTGCIKGFLIDFRLLLLKDSKYIFLNTIVGALTAVIFSYYLINTIGIIGVAISSFLAFYISMIIGFLRLFNLRSNYPNDWFLITSPFIIFIVLFLIKTLSNNSLY